MFEIPIGTLAEEKEAELAKVTPFMKVLLNFFIVDRSSLSGLGSIPF